MSKPDENLWKSMLQVIWPSFLLAILQAFVTAFDAKLASHIGINELAAISIIYPFFLMMQTVSLGGFGGAVSASVARAAAQKSHRLIKHSAAAGLLLAALVGVLCSSIFLLIGEQMLGRIAGSIEVPRIAYRYGLLMIGFSPVFWICNCLLSIARGLGLVKQTMRAASIVYPIQMVVMGVLVFTGWTHDIVVMAFASITGVLIIGIITSHLIASNLRALPKQLDVATKWKRTLSSIASVGLFASLASIISGASLILLSAVVASRYGRDVLSAFGVVFRIEVIMMLIASSVGVAVVTMGAAAFVKKDFSSVLDICRLGVTSTAVLVGAFGILSALQPQIVLSPFALSPETNAIASVYLNIVGFSYPLMAVGFASFFVGQGLGRPRWFFAAALARFLFLMLALAIGPSSFQALIQVIAFGYCLFGALAILALLNQRTKLKNQLELAK